MLERVRNLFRAAAAPPPPEAAAVAAPAAETAGEALPAAVWPVLKPFLARLHERFGSWSYLLGTCPVCGENAAFVGDFAIARESMLCSSCLTTCRYRTLALGVLRAIERATGVRVPSLAALASVRPFASNQNLERLTFGDGSFDLVLTSDVMGHVRPDAVAHREIRRLLAPGGCYVSTVPHTRAQRDTLHRVVVHDPNDPARDEHVLPDEFHGDANDAENAALSYSVYGTELDEGRRALGFTVDSDDFDRPEVGVAHSRLFFCSLSKP